MTAGTTIPLPVASGERSTPLVADDSYFSLALHNAQAYLGMGWLHQVAYLICSTEVSSTLLPKHTMQSLHKVETIRKNTPSPLGLSVVLTDWLPATLDARVRITLKLVMVKDKPFGKLTEKIGTLGLASPLSLVAPQLSTGIKIAEIAGTILSTVLEEGQEQSVLALSADLLVQELKTGYLAVLAPDIAGDTPVALELRPDGSLYNPRAPFSERTTYAVFKVRARERRGTESARSTIWWNLLQDGLRQLRRLDHLSSDQERTDARRQWRDILERADRLAAEDKSFLLSEVRQMIKVHADEAFALLQPPILGGSPFETTTTPFVLDEEFQRLLGVPDMTSLKLAVNDYQQALARSEASS